MFKKFAIAATAAVGLGYAASNLLDSGLVACDIDGDGQVYVQSDEGKISATRGWRLASNGNECVTGGGSSEPMFLPRRDLVNHVGQPSPKP